MNPVIEAFRPYKDGFGLVQPNELGSGNGIRYTCEYLMALHINNAMTPEENERIGRDLSFCESQNQPGLLNRSPVNFNQEGPDDYVARLGISSLLDNTHARSYPHRFLIHWDNNKGIFQNDGKTDNPSAWFFRMPHLRAHAMFCGGGSPDLFQMFWWSLTIVQSMFSKKHDSKILSWYLVRAAKDKSRIAKLLAIIWSHFLKKQYPDGGIGQVLREYFLSNHPSAVYLWGVFD